MLSICMCLLAICTVFREMSTQILCLFLHWTVFLLQSCRSSLCIWDTSPRSDVICKCFLSFWVLSFHFLDGALSSINVCNFGEVQFTFSLDACMFSTVSKKTLPNPKTQSYTFFFSFFLALTIGALFHFQLTFWIWCEVGFQINSLACGYPVFWHHLLKKQFFPHWMILAPWLKINELKIHGFLSGLSILLHWSMSVPHKLGHCSSEVSFEIRKCESTTSFFFKIVSSVLNPLHFHMDFGSSLSISIKI